MPTQRPSTQPAQGGLTTFLNTKLVTGLIAGVVLAAIGITHAALPNREPGELKADAQHIVTGKVAQVYTSSRAGRKNYVDTLYAIELRITKVSKTTKDSGLKPGQTLFVKTWQAEQRPDGWAGPSGQGAIPKAGQTATFYLGGSKGSYQALLPNGIDVKGPAK